MTTAGCSTWEASIWDLLDGVLETDDEARLREHLAACPGCAGALAELQTVHAGLEAIGAEPDVADPEWIGRYRILRRIGQGGMGVVYEAEQPSPARRVALKVVRPDIAGEASRVRAFRREVEALGRLRHPAIATVYDAGRTAEGQFFLVMELIEGEALDCFEQDSDLRARVARTATVAEAVEYAHSRGIVHRDLKPANVLVEPDGTPRVLDFGLARFLEPGADVTAAVSITRHGSPAGTLPYISPEYLLGQTAAPDVKGDVYALGVMLFQQLTGRLPYDFGAGAGVLDAQRAVARAEPLQPRAVDASIPRDVAAVAARAIAKDPARRYASAADLAADLRAWLDGRPVTARSPGPVLRLWAWTRRRRAALLGAAALAAGLAGAAFFNAPKGRAAAPTRTHFEIPDAVLQLGVLPRQVSFGPSGRLAVHTHRREGERRTGIAVWDRPLGVSRHLDLPEDGGWEYCSPRLGPGGHRIAMLGQRFPGGEHDHEVAVFVHDLRSGEHKRLVAPGAVDKPRDLCWQPGGGRITFVTRSGELCDVDLDGVLTRWPVTTSSGAWELDGYAPDGRWLLFNTRRSGDPGRDLWVLPAGGGRAQRLTSLPGDERSARFAPDGRSVWFVSTTPGSAAVPGSSNVFRCGFDPATGGVTGAVEQVTFYRDVELADLAFAGAGRDLIVRVRHRRSEIRAQAAAAARPQTLVGGSHPRPAPDGSAVFYVDRVEGGVGLFRIPRRAGASPARLAAPEGIGGREWSFHLSPDGDSIACSGRDAAGPGVFVVTGVARGDGSAVERVAAAGGAVWPRWSPDGAAIAYVDDAELLVHELSSGRARRVASAIWGFEPWTLRWSPDGAAIMVVAYETPAEKAAGTNGVFLVSWPSGEARRIVPSGEAGYREGVEWHPGGAFLTAVTTDHEIRKIFPDGRPTELFLDDPEHCEYTGVWDVSGTRFVFQCLGGPACAGGPHTYDLRNGRLVADPRPFDGGAPSWSRDGSVAVWVRESRGEHFEWLGGVR